MCGRYSLTTAPEALRRLFDFDVTPNLEPRYNIAPTQSAPVVRPAADGTGRELAMLRWGLIPSWAKDASIGNKMINARAETVAEKPSFRSAFRHRRCLVPADGFYEWRREGEIRQPFRIGMKGGAPFAFAGLWESWTGQEDGTAIETFTIITTNANRRLLPIHARMPVILAPEAYDTWLDVGPRTAEPALAILRPFREDPMAFYRVSTHVNSPRNDDPNCLKPLAQSS
jgi:putative SOS response-associated peptidase YedK